MKKIYSLITILFIFTQIASAQMVRNISANKKSAKKVITQNHKNRRHSLPNTSNSVIWSDDFSIQSNWVIDHEAGTDGDWIIGLTGPGGAATIPTIQSLSASNGFAKFDSDSLCTGNQIGNLTTALPINLNGYPNVKLEFSQYYARYYDSTYIFVSIDNINWTKFEVNENLTINQFSANNPAANPDVVSIDISSVAGNQSAVWIRFQFYSPNTIDPLAGCGYSWMIDDISISEISSVDGAVQPLAFGGEYSNISLLNSSAFSLQGKIINKGSTPISSGSLNFNVFNSSGLVHSDIANIPITINAGDTSEILSPSGSFAPIDTGLYIIQQIATIASDGDASNDTAYAFVFVDDSTNARDYIDFNPATYLNGGFGFINGFTGTLGQIYHIYQSSQLTSGTIYLEQPIVGSTLSLTVSDVSGGLPNTILGSSAIYTITSADTVGGNGVVLTIPFSNPINVTQGDYFLGVNQLDTNFLSLGATSDIYTENKIFFTGGGNWFDVGTVIQASFIARLNNPSATLLAVPSIDKNNSVTVFPNPTTGIINLSSKMIEGKTIINILNSSGKNLKSFSFSNLTNQKIDMSEFVSGSYTIQFIYENKVVNKKVVLVKN